MIALDWTTMSLGAALGALAGTLFFAGLAWGMRIALRGSRPAGVLLASAALRIAALLVLIWWVAGQGPFALAGFAIGFFLVRIGVQIFARTGLDKGAHP